MTELSANQRLVLAGWRRSPVLRAVRAGPDEVSDDELVFWTDPESGATLTERQALERLAEREEKD